MISITDVAATRIKKVLEDNKRTADSAVLRIAIQGGGCSGFQYAISIEEAPQDTDNIYTIKEVRIAIDPISKSYLQGAELDFVGDFEGGFKIKNPNTKSSCGCGQSFEPK